MDGKKEGTGNGGRVGGEGERQERGKIEKMKEKKSVNTLGVSIVLQIVLHDQCLRWFYLEVVRVELAWNRKLCK